MAGRPYVLAETNWTAVESTRFEMAILPWGATEAHNRHLPYGTDNLEAEHIAIEAARRAWQAGARVVVLPTVPFGVQTGQLDIPLCLNLNPSTQARILTDLAESLAVQGVRKLVLLNGHGGNDFRAILRELQPRVDLFLCSVDWFRVVPRAGFFDEPGDHADEMETSAVLAIAPELVLPLDQAGPGRERRFRVAALREGWAWAPRQWREVTEDTGVGDPRAATAERGERYLAAVVERVAGFLIELAAADPAAMYGDPDTAQNV